MNVACGRRYHIISINATESVDSSVIPKPVIVPPMLDNGEALSDSDVSTTTAQPEQPRLTIANEVERRKVAVPSGYAVWG